jgi:hypothetical protein
VPIKLDPLRDPPFALIDCPKKRVRWDRVSRDGVCNVEHSSARPCARHAWSQARLALLWPPPLTRHLRAEAARLRRRGLGLKPRPIGCSAELTLAAKTPLCFVYGTRAETGTRLARTLRWVHCAKGLSLCRTENPSRSDCLIVGTSCTYTTNEPPKSTTANSISNILSLPPRMP